MVVAVDQVLTQVIKIVVVLEVVQDQVDLLSHQVQMELNPLRMEVLTQVL